MGLVSLVQRPSVLLIKKKQGREELQRTADTDGLKIRMRGVGSEDAPTAFA